MKFIFCFGLLCLTTLTSYGQYSVSGRVVDNTEQQPVEYASVGLYNLSDSSLVNGAVSQPGGSFTVSDVPSGTYYLVVQFMGYDKQVVSGIRVNQDVQLRTVALAPNQELLDEIEVTGKKMTAMSKVDRQVFDAKAFQASEGGTATDVLRNLPSVTVGINGEIRSRGTAGFVVMLNGKPLQTSAEVILNQLPANAIQNIEVITAPSAKYDPEGTAGIINITTNQNATDGLFSQFNVRVGLPSIEDYNNAAYHQRYGGDATVNYRKGPWNLSFGLSYLRNDQGGRRVGNAFTILQDTTTLFPSNGERSLDNENYSGRFTVSYTPNPKNTFSLGFYAGVRNKVRTADILYFNNRGVVNGEEAYNFQYFNENERTRNGDFVLGSIDYAHTFANSSRLSTSFLYEYTLLGGPTFNFNRAFPNTEQVLQEEFNTNDNPLNGLRYQLNYAFAEQEWGKVETGYQFRYLDHTGNFVYQRRNLNTGEFELIPAFSSEVDLTRLIHSGFAQFSGEKGRWTYGAGVRLEYMDRKLDLQDKLGAVDTTYVYDFIQPYPSANLQYAFTDFPPESGLQQKGRTHHYV
jgi:iron complex outermembrane recepter protein